MALKLALLAQGNFYFHSFAAARLDAAAQNTVRCMCNIHIQQQ